MRDHANKAFLKDRPSTTWADYLTIAAVAALYFLVIVTFIGD